MVRAGPMTVLIAKNCLSNIFHEVFQSNYVLMFLQENSGISSWRNDSLNELVHLVSLIRCHFLYCVYEAERGKPTTLWVFLLTGYILTLALPFWQSRHVYLYFFCFDISVDVGSCKGSDTSRKTLCSCKMLSNC